MKVLSLVVWCLEAEDGRLVLGTLPSAGDGHERPAARHDGRIPDNAPDIERGHHDELQASGCRRQRRSERVVAVGA